MKKRSNFLIIAMVMLGLTTMLSSCGQTEKKSAIDRIKESGELVVATSGHQFPFSFKDKDGVLKGIDIEFANVLAKEMGVKIKFVEEDLSSIISYVASDKADIAISSLTVTDERSKLVLFSDPYFVTGKGVLSKIEEVQEAVEGSKDEDLYKIAVVDNSSSLEYAKKHYPKAHLMLTKNLVESREALYTGMVDGLLADYEICETLSFDKRNNGDYNFKRIGDANEKEYISVAVAPSDTLLLKQINTHIDKIKKGEVDQMVEEKWLQYLN
jgi:polar amino acid transport system substrate-binding protein